MKNDSIFNRIPLPLMIVIWLGLVAVGAVLVYSVFFSKPTDSTTQATAKKTPTAQVAQATKPAATPAAAQPVTPSLATIQPTINPKLGPDGLYPAMDFGYGVQVNGLVGDAKLSAELADKLHARWIKQQLQWGVFEHEQGKIDWTGFDNIINAAHDRGLRVMLSIPTAPQWTHPDLQPSTPPGENDPDAIKGPPADPQAYANFVGQVVDRYKGKVQAIEVWNEQNLVREWRTNPQSIDAKAYLALLSAAYKTIKEKDPNITVISGALSPTGPGDGVHSVDDFVYFQQMVDAGLLDVVDCVGAHHNGYNIGPNVSAKDAPSLPKAATAAFKGPFDNSKGDPDHSWFFKDTLQGYNKILQGKKPICVTEFGWATSKDYDSFPPGFEFAQDNSVEEQGANIVEAYQLMKEWGFVKLAFLWNLDYGNKGNAELGPKDDSVPYSLIKTDGSKRASWDPVRKLLKQVTGDD
jgi:polysaccharide biosynthesis protein PslG